jgi:hypothetical protein
MNVYKRPIIPSMVLRSGPDMEGSRAGIGYALQAGASRVVSGPVVLAGSAAIVVLLWLLPYLGAGSVGIMRGAFPLWLTLDRVPLTEASLVMLPDVQTSIAWLLLWSFAAGGVLDRYARGHATRGRGFFAACGAHFPSMFRLGLLTLLVDATIWTGLVGRIPAAGVFALAVVLCLAVHLVSCFARVRLVVEDRRSAFGAVLAAMRFVRRQPAGAGLTMMYAAVAAGVAWVYVAAFPLNPPYNNLDWRSFGGGAALIVASTALLFAGYASQIVLFQARLAHAGYTAAPPLQWPDSPAAEAIANAAPTFTR